MAVETFISTKYLKPLWKQLVDRFNKRDKVIDAVADTFGDPRLLAKFYIEPGCQYINPADNDDRDTALAFDPSPVFTIINNFFSGDLVERDGRSQLFVLADAGMGKSSLLVMLRLAQLFRFFPSRFRCELLKLGPDTLERIKALPDKKQTILLLDALDEDPTALRNTDHRLAALLEATKHFHRVVISSRTQFFPEVTPDRHGRRDMVDVVDFTCPLIYLSPFSDAQVDDYLSRRFPTSLKYLHPGHWKNQGLCDKAKGMVKQMESLRSRPLLLSHMDELVKVEREQWNSYTLYEEMVTRWLQREVRKMRKIHADWRETPSVEVLLKACIYLAEAMQLKGQGVRTLTEAELERLIRSRDPLIEHLIHFQPEGRSLLNRNSAGEFRFSHYTFQEFLLFYGVTKGMVSFKPLIKATEPIRQFARQTGTLDDCLEKFFPGSLTIVEKVCDESGPEMALIPAGEFQMGEDKSGSKGEMPAHKVLVSTFAISRYPVTVGEFRRFLEHGADAGFRKQMNNLMQLQKYKGFFNDERLPMTGVSWMGATAYCRWLSEQTGADYRLPTEAEWEYAARAGSASRYFWGRDDKESRKFAWYGEGVDVGKTHPVGRKQPNLWGLHDMVGNCWEWCADGWHEDYHGAPKEAVAWTGGQDDTRRVVRGGSWLSAVWSLRSATRNSYQDDNEHNFLGFRVARNW